MSAIRRISTVLFCVLTLVACQEDGALPAEGDSTIPDVMAGARTDCERAGGRWGLTSSKTSYVCYRAMPDANKTCRSADDCDGLCLARSRTCSPIEPFYGCHQVLSGSGLPQTMCIE
ncbi:hypothetical protein EF888_03900 [Silicimonas algicola]|uniref:Uncharacterized protein n=1 Tax=Silicimonas algicola TaxID=1826607 RepID=A0A316GCH3_9RHOB|nr:hypothetical protein [Silicimonas algicola]AZQ66349.1 hypothetical protein EF888_03900 [Silicimonas algicola]PWK58679.1 hypothetical protein C8D95_101494 [Silicimonas algicola]